MKINHLYNENCLDTMQRMPDNYIDFVITSPPYDEIRNYNGYRFMNRTKEKKVGNVFFYSVGGGISTKDKIAFQHPAIFPEKLVIDQINTWTNENDLVYDPFMGSGTTAKVAQMLNREWIGSEISVEYVQIAEERIKNINMET